MKNYPRNNILFLTDQSEHFSFNLAKNISLLSKNSFSISSVDIYNQKFKQSWDNIYNIFGSRISKFFRLIKTIRSQNVIVILYVNPIWSFLIPFMIGKKIILVFYGSDFYRAKFIGRISLKLLIWSSDAVVFTSDKMLNDVVRTIGFQRKIGFQKYNVINFGNNILPHIAELKKDHSKKDIKISFGINPNKIVITLGYNGSKAHNHLKLIDTIRKLSQDILNRTHIMLPFNYSFSKSYNDEILSRLSSVNIGFTTKYGFLNPEEISKVRFCSDIFVNNIETDNMSASVLEYLFADNIVLMTSRVNYDEYAKLGYKFEQFDDLNELYDLLLKSIVTYKQPNNLLNKVDNYKYSWEYCAINWINLLNGLGH